MKNTAQMYQIDFTKNNLFSILQNYIKLDMGWDIISWKQSCEITKSNGLKLSYFLLQLISTQVRLMRWYTAIQYIKKIIFAVSSGSTLYKLELNFWLIFGSSARAKARLARAWKFLMEIWLGSLEL